MHKALDNLLVKPEHILVDGVYFPIYTWEDQMIPYTCVEGGDNKYLSIAAASIIAKVERDKYIYDLCDSKKKMCFYIQIILKVLLLLYYLMHRGKFLKLKSKINKKLLVQNLLLDKVDLSKYKN